MTSTLASNWPSGFGVTIRNYVAVHHSTGYLFTGDSDGRIGSKWLDKLIDQRLPRPWNLHSLRHRFATTIYQQAHDIIIVRQLLGRESVATTQTRDPGTKRLRATGRPQDCVVVIEGPSIPDNVSRPWETLAPSSCSGAS